MLKRFLLCLLCCLLLCASALGEETAEKHTDPIRLDTMEEVLAFCPQGFLAEGSIPIYYQNHAEGRWLYVSSTERIDITRYTEQKPALMYCVAHIYLAEGNAMAIKSVNPERPGSREAAPANLAATVRAVYAQNTDFFTYRVKYNQIVGYIVRGGKILHRQNMGKLYIRLPNLSTMGLYPDGHAELNEAFEKSADEYVAEGATDVIAFGPLLIRDGEIQDLDQGTYRNKEPRSAIGWVDSHHYVGLLVEGRRDHSKGADMLMCAQILKEHGCTNAINLDGGGSAAMLFMGESVQMTDKGNVANTTRWMPDLLCAGFY